MLANAEEHAPVAMLPAAKEMIASDAGAVHIHRASPPSTVQESEESASEADNEAEVVESTPRGGAIQSPTTYAEAAAVPAGTEAKVRGEEDDVDVDVAETPRVAPVELQRDTEAPKPTEQAPQQSSKSSPQPAPARVPTPPSREQTATPPSRPSSSFPGAAFPGAGAARAGSATPPAMTRSSSATSAPRDDSSAAGSAAESKGETKGERRRKRLSSIKGFVRRMSDQGKPSLSRSNSQTGSARSYESEGERSKRNSSDAKRNSTDTK